MSLFRTQQRIAPSRAYFDRRVAQGETKKEALRALKRDVSFGVRLAELADRDHVDRVVVRIIERQISAIR